MWINFKINNDLEKDIRLGEMGMRMAYKSDIGRIRTVNEDRAFALTNEQGITVAIVADGMGGHQAGDIASQKATQMIQEQLLCLEQDLSKETYAEQVREAVMNANKAVFQISSQQEKYHGMGTTVVVALVCKNNLIIGHIGDSRAYRFRQGSLTQITEDHSLVNELVKTGQITLEEAEHHPRRNVLIRALGTDADVKVDVQALTWESGDILLLCTDGLSGLIDQYSIESIIKSNANVDQACNELIESALAAGGDDNVTVVILTSEELDESGVKQ
jgi:serine/threonine protein phosphatase PrpC